MSSEQSANITSFSENADDFDRRRLQPIDGCSPCGRSSKTSNRQRPPTKVPTVRIYLKLVIACKLLRNLEAAIGIEPMNKGFAVLMDVFFQGRWESELFMGVGLFSGALWMCPSRVGTDPTTCVTLVIHFT